jgi:hypothetical protein
MKSSQITLIIIGFILLALMATNPSIEDHRQAVTEKMKEKMTESSNSESKNEWQKAGEAIGMAIGGGIVEKSVSRDNYLLFSLTKITFGDKSKNIGLGIIGNVWIFNDSKFGESDNDNNNGIQFSDSTVVITDQTNAEIEPNISLEIFAHEEVEKNDQLAFSTEGNDYSTDKESYKSKKYFVSTYGLATYIKVNNQIEVLKQSSFQKLPSGFKQILKNGIYKLIIIGN